MPIPRPMGKDKGRGDVHPPCGDLVWIGLVYIKKDNFMLISDIKVLVICGFVIFFSHGI